SSSSYLRFYRRCSSWRHHSSLFLFFQAEDGIRHRNVTGVQTCALPIWTMLTLGNFVSASDIVREMIEATPADRSATGLPLFHVRSEERRVGKEGRGLRAERQRKEKNQK